MLILQNISYTHPNKDLLFDNVHLALSNRDKVALIGNNGAGKSTLLKIISGEIVSFGGQLQLDATPYYIPQLFGQYNHLTVAQALHVDDKLNALKEILGGEVTDENMDILGDDWNIEERCREAMEYWQLAESELTRKMETLSGGQKTKVFLAGISIHQPEFVLLDEPSNHLDGSGRQLLYDFIGKTPATLLIVSHDRKLLNLLDIVCELSRHGIAVYGGNYDFYAEQKQAEKETLNQDIKSKEKALRKAKEKERESVERQQKLDACGKKKQEKAGVAKILMNTLRNKAENSTAKLKSIHSERIGNISQHLQSLRLVLPNIDKMKFGFDNSALHKGKIIFKATGINFGYGKWFENKLSGPDDDFDQSFIWTEKMSFQITSGERIVIKGFNGSGKTTLIKIILGRLKPQEGVVYQPDICSVYIDQDYSWIKNEWTVYEQAQQYNVSALEECEIKSRLKRFLFTKEDWNKSCHILSGGEKMRLMLCCLTINNHAPDMIILDEPTNNLDIRNIEILTAAINEYQGTLIVVSHDEMFLEQTGINRTIRLSEMKA
jgi:ATPase subunit of ABC transporter with duplicated ATPase domains